MKPTAARQSSCSKTDGDVRRLENRRAMVIDAHGIHYLIPDTEALDRQSRRILERYL